MRKLDSPDHRRRRPEMEVLEDRWAPAVFGVTGLADAAGSVDFGHAGTEADPYLASTLRAAVNESNLIPGADTIVFAAGLTSGGPATIDLSLVGDFSAGASALMVTDELSIQGATGGNGITIARDAAGPDMRLFHVAGTGSLTIESLTLTNGKAQGGAGGNASFGGAGGGAAGLGGAIFNEGTLKLVQSTLSGNSAVGGAGGAVIGGFNYAGGGGGGLDGAGASNPVIGGGAGGAPNGSGGGGSAGGFGGGGAGGNLFGSLISSGQGPGGSGGFGGGAGGGGLASGNAGYPGGAGGFGGGGGGGGANQAGGVVIGGPNGFGGGSGGNAGFNSSQRGGGGGGGAGFGGAVFNNGGSVSVINSTLANNSATGGTGGAGGGGSSIRGGDGDSGGGALFSRNGSVTLLNATISGNTAAVGRGVYLLGDSEHGGGDPSTSSTVTADIDNTIIAQNDTAILDLKVATNGSGAADTSGGNNIIGSSLGFGGSAVAADPQLSALGPNGGPTETMAITTSSPAFNKGSAGAAAGLQTDQRGDGFRRVRAGAVDIGAFEWVPNTIILNYDAASGQVGLYGLDSTGETIAVDTPGDNVVHILASSNVVFVGDAVGNPFFTGDNSTDVTFHTAPGQVIAQTLSVELGGGDDTLDLSLDAAATGVANVRIDMGTGDDSTTLGSILIGGSLTSLHGTIDVSSAVINTQGKITLDADAVTTGTALSIDGSTLNAGGNDIELAGAGGGSAAIRFQQATLKTNGTAHIKLHAGAGAAIAQATNTFLAAGIDVEDGVFSVDGPLAGDATVNVKNGARLRGTGAISGDVNVESGGVIAPGNSSGVGTLGTGDLTLASGGNAEFTVNGITPGIEFGQLDVAGVVTLGGATGIFLGGVADNPGQVITVIKNDGGEDIDGVWSGRAEGSTVTINGVDFLLSYKGGAGGNAVTLSQKYVPAFGGLTSQTISYGTSTTTFAGALFAGVLPATGTVTVAVSGNSITPIVATGTLDAGGFSIAIDTSSLVVGINPYTVAYSYAGGLLFTPAADSSTTLTVEKADQTITWASPVIVTYGTPLDAAQLNAVVTAPGAGPTGAITYTPSAGTVLTPVFNQQIRVDVAGTADYNAVSKTVYVASENELYVRALYHDALGRNADPTGLSHWCAMLDQGQPRALVASQIIHSAEHYATRVVNPIYQQLLGRSADPAGLAGWVPALQSGSITTQQFIASVLASAEFIANAGPTHLDWLNSVYTKSLGRPLDPAGQATWLEQLDAGVSTFQVALMIASGVEPAQALVQADYTLYLGRPVDSGGLATWTRFLVGLLYSNEDVILNLVTSPEYAGRLMTRDGSQLFS